MGIYSDINEVSLLGNVVKSYGVTDTGKGVAMARFDMATNKSYKKDDEWQTEAEFHKIIAFGLVAESLKDKLDTGDKVLVFGSIKTNKWTDREGLERKDKSIIASRVHLFDRKKKAEQKNGQETIDIDTDDLPF